MKAFQTEFRGDTCKIMRNGVPFIDVIREPGIPMTLWRRNCEKLRTAFDMSYREAWLDLTHILKGGKSKVCSGCMVEIGKKLKELQP